MRRASDGGRAAAGPGPGREGVSVAVSAPDALPRAAGLGGRVPARPPCGRERKQPGLPQKGGAEGRGGGARGTPPKWALSCPVQRAGKEMLSARRAPCGLVRHGLWRVPRSAGGRHAGRAVRTRLWRVRSAAAFFAAPALSGAAGPARRFRRRRVRRTGGPARRPCRFALGRVPRKRRGRPRAAGAGRPAGSDTSGRSAAVALTGRSAASRGNRARRAGRNPSSRWRRGAPPCRRCCWPTG